MRRRRPGTSSSRVDENDRLIGTGFLNTSKQLPPELLEQGEQLF
jgi:hypothetical protein